MRVIAICVIFLSAIVVFLQARFCLANDYGEWLDRCEAHRASVERILTEEDISTDYYYLMVAESKCTPDAESDKGAQGPWQLMPATARHYGCDDPHDIECATRAAAGYIRHLETCLTTRSPMWSSHTTWAVGITSAWARLRKPKGFSGASGG